MTGPPPHDLRNRRVTTAATRSRSKSSTTLQGRASILRPLELRRSRPDDGHWGSRRQSRRPRRGKQTKRGFDPALGTGDRVFAAAWRNGVVFRSFGDGILGFAAALSARERVSGNSRISSEDEVRQLACLRVESDRGATSQLAIPGADQAVREFGTRFLPREERLLDTGFVFNAHIGGVEQS